MLKGIGTALTAAMLLNAPAFSAETPWVHGKVDTGPAFVELSSKQGGQKLSNRSMYGSQLGTTLVFTNGVCLQSSHLAATGGMGSLVGNGASIGFYIPVTDWISVQPHVGYSWSRSEVQTMERTPVKTEPVIRKLTSRSQGPSTGIDVYLKPHERWMVSGRFDYAWTDTTFSIPGFTRVIKQKLKSPGFSTGVSVDYYLTRNWSINAAGQYNLSQAQDEKDKIGVQARGVRVGMGYRF